MQADDVQADEIPGQDTPVPASAGEFVRLEVDPATRVGTIRLDRPPMNAISLQVWAEIEAAASSAALRDDVGAVVVWGGPKVFAAGADIREMPGWDPREVPGIVALLHRSLAALAAVPKVTIAAVAGYALGGGCELALACDLRFAADNAKFGQPEVLLGLVPGAGGTQRLPRLVGPSRAKELVFSGRMVDSVEAQRIGLVDEVCPVDDLHGVAVAAAARYAAGPASIALAKRAIDEGAGVPLDDALRIERELFAACFETDDARIGLESFLEHGPGQAGFTGR